MRKILCGNAKNWANSLIGIAGLLMVITAQAATPSAPVLCLDAASSCTSTTGASPYPWYPALDLNQIPFHVGAGAWGPRVAIQAPAAPVITSQSTASNLAQLSAAMAVPGRRVTITANIIGGAVMVPTITDVEVIVPNGILVKEVTFGRWQSTVFNRVRFTKPSGETIGGQLHQFDVMGASFNDLIIDGLQFSGSGAQLAIYFDAPVNRAAIVNNRMRSNTAVFGYGGTHLVVAGNSAQHDANGTIEGGDWGFRNGGGQGAVGPYVYFRNDIRGAHYSPLRFHPSPGVSPFYAWISQNVFAGSTENRFIEIHDATDESNPAIAGVWILNNTAYVNGGLGMNMSRAGNYARINGNTIYGTTSGLNSGPARDSDVSGNTYGARRADPAWGAAGDPTGINVTP